jgi:hypothetical protein
LPPYLWLADKVHDVLKNEALALKALAEAEKQLKQEIG